MRKKMKSIAGKSFALGLSFVMVFSSTTFGYSGFSGEYTRSERLTQPSVTSTFAKNELGVVNFKTTWGDKEANIASMDKYIEEADKKGVKILLFPEMCVTGYVSSSDPESEEYKWAVSSAEPLDGPTAQHFAEIADKDDMWIIYGATQTIEENGEVDTKHAYNSAFVCSPDGEVTAYQKITPVEGSWCESGDTPVIIEAGEYGKLGISICYDTYSTPELERYYAAMGCNILINPTASGGGWSQSNMAAWEEYYKLRLESIASRDGYTILSSNLVGMNGKDDSAVEFPGGSIIVQGEFSGVHYFAGEKNSDGTKITDASIVTNEEGLLTNTVALTAKTGTTCNNIDFNPEMYVELYKELAEIQAEAGGKLSYKPTTTEGPKVATVNMTGYWGNKTKTLDKMIEYIEEAGEQGVNILVFPETVLSGYGYLEPNVDPFYQKFGVSMQVATAETIPGTSTNLLSTYAQKYNMYIFFGMCEKDESGPIYDSNNNNTNWKNVEKVYNSVAILYPDGKIDSYQKIHRAGNMEYQWSVSGSTPKIIETPWGKAGIDICMDGHFFPELGRYYAAKGCTLFIHPTATGGNAWYRATRIGSYVDRDGMAAITSNLLGGDGIYTAPGDEKYNPRDFENNFEENNKYGETFYDFVGGSYDKIPDQISNKNEIENDPYWVSSNWTYGTFASTSIIITKGITASTELKPRINYNGTGSESEGFAERGGTSPLGLEIADMDLTGCGFSGTTATFRPDLYSKLYDKLASLYRGGYTSVYGEDAIPEPVTVKLTSADSETTAQEPTSATETTTVTATTTTAVTETTATETVRKPAKATVKSATKKKAAKKVSVKLKKITGATGYQIQISSTKKFKKVLVKKKVKKVKFTITSKSLKNKKKLYMKARAYVKSGSKTVYGKWSLVKKVTIKK